MAMTNLPLTPHNGAMGHSSLVMYAVVQKKKIFLYPHELFKLLFHVRTLSLPQRWPA